MENSMRSIARALNTIALAINNLAKALTPPKEQVTTFPISSTFTTSSGSAVPKNVKITSVYQGKNYLESKQAIKAYEENQQEKIKNATASYGQWSIDGNQSPKIAHIHKEEKVALDALHATLTEKSVNSPYPTQRDFVMKDLSIKWPALHKALNDLVVARKESYNRPSSEIWKKNNVW